MSTTNMDSISKTTKRRGKTKSVLGATLGRSKKALEFVKKSVQGKGRSVQFSEEETDGGRATNGSFQSFLLKNQVKKNSIDSHLDEEEGKKKKTVLYDGDKVVDENNIQVEERVKHLIMARAQRRQEIFEATLEADNESKESRGSLRSAKSMRTDADTGARNYSIKSLRASNKFSMSMTLKGRLRKRSSQRSEDSRRFRNINLPQIPKSEEDKALIRSALHENMFFSSLSEEEVELVVNAMSLKDVPAGEVFIKEGDKGEEFYVVKKGLFKLSKNNGTRILSECGKGKSFGELAVIHPDNLRMATVTSAEDCQVFALDRMSYRKLMAYSEDDKLRQIRNVLSHITLLQSLSKNQISDIADCVELVKFNEGDPIIVKGDVGNVFYMIKSGKVQVTKVGNQEDALKDIVLGPNDYFGERAMLADEPRAANVIAIESVECLALDRESFTRYLGSLKDVMNKNLAIMALKTVPLLHDLPTKKLSKLCESLEEVRFMPGEQIIEQGTKHRNLYIIIEGEVEVVVFDHSDRQKHTVLTKLKAGDYFGESALKNTPATAEVTSVGSVRCQAINTRKYFRLLKPLAQTIRKKQTARNKSALEAVRRNSSALKEFELTISFDELESLRTLGTGSFGRVKLVEHKKSKQPFALKILQKAYIVQCKQQKNVMNEKMVMIKSQHPFLLKLHKTFQTKNCLYFLLEYIQGGELFSYLGTHHKISNNKAKFFAACVVDALGYLHKRQIVYRDLKPENILLDADGYVRIVDFGFAKKVETKTYTLCGTPEYLPPEVIQSVGHTRAVDYWAIGVLIYEMMSGFSPFKDTEDDDQGALFERIIAASFSFPRGFPTQAKEIIRALMHRTPHDRLGMFKDGPDEIKQHPWFASISFEDLLEKRLAAPWKPELQGSKDAQYFEVYEEDDSEIPYRGSNKYWNNF